MTKELEEYFESIDFKSLSEEEIKELFIRKESGDSESANIIIKSYLKYVFSIANQYAQFYPDLMELVQIGNLALV